MIQIGLTLLISVLSQPPGAKLQEPVRISADGDMKIDLKAQTGVVKENVLIERKDIQVCCDEAEAVYRGGQIEKVTCRGRVVIVRPDGTRAIADEAIYVPVRDRVTLKGRARFRRGPNDLRGKRIVYDMKRDRLEVRGRRSRFFHQIDAEDGRFGRACPPARKRK